MKLLHIEQAWRGGFEGRPGWWMTFHGGHETFLDGIEELKRCVPANERSYDPEEKRWWVSEEWGMQAAAIIGGLEAHLRQGSLL